MKIIEELEKKQLKTEIPKFNVGDTIKVFAKIIEGGKERLQAFEGLVLKIQGTGARRMFTVRKIVQGVGVERSFPLHSPKIDNIQVQKRGHVRRAKLYYMRQRIGSAASRVQDAKETDKTT